MPLINLKTDLKSLKFGKDRPGGGSSQQPFISKTNIDDIKTEDLGRSGGPDFLLRGGLLTPIRAAEDASRLFQLFTKTNTGVLFTAKQNLLSRIGTDMDGGYPVFPIPTPGKILNGPLNQGIYTPLSTLAQVAGGWAGLHLDKQGLNPITGGPKYMNLVNPLGANKNIAGIGAKQFNRLVRLYDRNIATDSGPSATLFTYGGGPGSILGIGKTTIRTTKERTTFISTGKTGAIGYATFDQNQISNIGIMGDGDGINNNNGLFGGLGSTTLFPSDFRKALISDNTKSFISDSPDYTEKNIEKRVYRGGGNPGKRGVDRSNYTIGRPDLSKGVDTLNSLYLYRSENVTNDERKNDLVKFRIATIDNDEPLKSVFAHFRAFINSFTDSMNASWNRFKYAGRGEDFFTYQGFNNTISMDFTVAAQSKQEMSIMYQKLNYIKSTLAPDYSEKGYMRGSIHKLTMGGYFYEVPGIIESLTYTIPNDTPWEIGIPATSAQDTNALGSNGFTDSAVKELPHRIEVSMTFSPIYKFLPRKVKNIDGNNGITQRFISLEDARDNNNLYAGKYLGKDKNGNSIFDGVPLKYYPEGYVKNPNELTQDSGLTPSVTADAPILTGAPDQDGDGLFAGETIQTID